MTQKRSNKKASTRNILITALVIALIAGGLVFTIIYRKNNQPILDKIRDDKKIVVAMEGTWLPWTYHDAATGELVGYDVEVAKAVAAKMGVGIEFQECPWDSIFAGIESGRYDIAVNGIDWTEKRSRSFTLSEPYVYSYPVLIVRSDEEEIKDFADLKGKQTANTVSSTYAALAESYGAPNPGVDDLTATFQLLIDGRINATINSRDTFVAFMDENPNAPLKIASQATEANPVVIAMIGGERAETLVVEINKAIAALREDGTLAALSVKYFGSDMTQAPAAAETAQTQNGEAAE